jgi:hypothetical protein
MDTVRFGDPGQFVSTWLERHPAADVRPISRTFVTTTWTKQRRAIVPIWVEDGDSSLNEDLVRAGMFTRRG